MINGENISQHEFEDIESYLQNTMSTEEKAGFEKRIRENTNLEKALNDYRMLIRGIESAGVQKMMDQFHNELGKKEKAADKEKPQKNPGIHISYYMAAASLLLIAVVAAFWLLNQKPEHEKLFARHFFPDPGLITPMSADADYLFFEAMVYYKSENYDIAIEKWESLANQGAMNDTLQYFLGVAHLANFNSLRAVEYLLKASTFENSVFFNETFFYLGLAYLKKGETEKAMEALQRSNMDESAVLLDELKK